jgi:hypothetical protein
MTVLGLLAFPAAAQTTTYTVSPAQDSHIVAGTPNTNHGTSTTLNVKGGATDTALALVQFTLPTIPFDE